MDDKTKISLTAAEIAMLWTQYINDTVSLCVNSHFLAKVEDEEVRPVIEFAFNGSKQNISFLNDFFIREKFPVPIELIYHCFPYNPPKTPFFTAHIRFMLIEELLPYYLRQFAIIYNISFILELILVHLSLEWIHDLESRKEKAN